MSQFNVMGDSLFAAEARWNATFGQAIENSRQTQGMGYYANNDSLATFKGWDDMLINTGQMLNDNFSPISGSRLNSFTGERDGSLLSFSVPNTTDAAGRIAINRDEINPTLTRRGLDAAGLWSIGDKDFRPSEEMMARYGVDDQGDILSDDTLFALANSRSELEMAYQRGLALKEHETATRREILGGPASLTLSLAGGFADPIVLASGKVAGLAGDVGGAAILGSRATRFGRMVQSGIVSSVENLGQGAALASAFGDDYDSNSAIRDIALGAFFGTAFGSRRFSPDIETAASKVAAAADRMIIAEGGGVTTPKADSMFASVPGHSPRASVDELRMAADAAIVRMGGEGDIATEAATGSSSIGSKVYGPDGTAGEVVRIEGDTAVIRNSKGEARVPYDSIIRDRAGLVEGAYARLNDGTPGVVERTDGESVWVRSQDGTVTTRYPADAIGVIDGQPTVLKGAAIFTKDGSAVLAFLPKSDASTFAHEPAHLFRRGMRTIDPNGADKLNDAMGEGADHWTVASEEKFANLFTRYLKDGRAPTKELTGVFEQFKGWLMDLWASIKGSVGIGEIDPRVRAAFDALLDAKQGRPFVGQVGQNRARIDAELRATTTDAKLADATMALLDAHARAWSRATQAHVDSFYSDVLSGVVSSLEKRTRVVSPAASAEFLGQSEPAVMAGEEGAATVVGADPSNPKYIRTANVSDAPAWATWARWLSKAGRVGDNRAPEARWLGRRIFEDAIVDRNGNARNADPATMQAARLTSSVTSKLARATTSAEEGYLKAKGISKVNIVGAHKARTEFREAAGRALRDNVPSSDPNVQAAVAAHQTATKEAFEINQANGGAMTGIDYDPNHMSVIWRDDLMHKNIQRFVEGADGVRAVFAAAFQKATGMNQAKAGIVAAAWVRRLQKYAVSSAAGKQFDLLRTGDFDHTIGVLREELETQLKAGIISDGELVSIAREMSDKEPGKPSLRFARYRTRMDYDEGVQLTDRATGQKVLVTPKDFMESNILRIGEQYVKATIGDAVMARVRQDFAVQLKKPEPFKSNVAMLEAVREKMQEAGNGADKIARDIERLDFAMRKVESRPVSDTRSTANEVGGAIRDLNYSTRSGSFGVPAVWEAAASVVRQGIDVTYKQMPVLAEYREHIRTGKPPSEMVKFALYDLGIGNLGALHMDRFNENQNEHLTSKGGNLVKKVRNSVGKLRDLATKANMVGAVTDHSQVLTTASVVQRIWEQAKTGKAPTALRLADLGVTPEQWKMIGEEIVSNANVTNGRVTGPGLDGWENLDAKALFIGVVNAKARTIIQDIDTGQLDSWIEKPMGRFITQFKSFMITSIEKQLLNNIRVMDREAYASFVIGTVTGSLQYLTSVYLASIGRDDREEFLDKMLTPGRLAMATTQRATFAAIGPTIYDSMATAAQYPSMGGFRASSLASDVVFGNPTVDLLMNGRTAPFRALRAAFDPAYDWSRDDMRASSSLIPMANLPGISQLLNTWKSRLPAQSAPQNGQ